MAYALVHVSDLIPPKVLSKRARDLSAAPHLSGGRQGEKILPALLPLETLSQRVQAASRPVVLGGGL